MMNRVLKNTVWVTDDNHAVAWSVVALLQSEGVSATAYTSGRALLERLRTGEQPSAMFLDITMAGLDGNSVLREILAEPKWTFPIIVLTGDEDTISPDVKGRIYKTLAKPAQPLELILYARKVLSMA